MWLRSSNGPVKGSMDLRPSLAFTICTIFGRHVGLELQILHLQASGEDAPSPVHGVIIGCLQIKDTKMNWKV